MASKRNPRRANGYRRNKVIAATKAASDHCAICGGYVDKSLPWWDDNAAACDEIIPVSQGGSPFSLANTQLTHRRCNQRRGNKSMDEVLGRSCEARHMPLKTSRQW